MSDRSFSFVRIHTRLIYVPILLLHTLALEHCILYALTCSLYPNIAEEKQNVLPIQALIPPISAAPRPPGLFLLLQAST